MFVGLEVQSCCPPFALGGTATAGYAFGTSVESAIVVIVAEMPFLPWPYRFAAPPADRATGLHERNEAGASLFVALVVAALVGCGLASVAASSPITR